MTEGRIIVISGLPGAGKNTTARLVAETLPRSAQIEADEMQKLIRSGGLWPEARDIVIGGGTMAGHRKPLIEAWSWMDDEIGERTDRHGLWLQTGSMTPEQVTAQVIERLDECVVAPR